MTKQDPHKLCKACQEFDYVMNRRDGVCLDVLVCCDHEDDCDEDLMKRAENREHRSDELNS